MGVRGLTSLVQSLPEVWFSAKLPFVKPGSAPLARLVVDGNALLYHLYFSSGLNCIGGGQYAEFAQVAREYIRALLNAGFTLFIVFDGLLEESKTETCIAREKDSIKRIKAMVNSSKEDVSEKILPPFVKSVFTSVLQELNVRFAFADKEADKVVARMAQQSGCCALSQDSDYFIYDLPGCYMPIESVRIVTGGLQTRRAHSEKLATKLGIPKNFLPLLATLSGNDHVGSEHLKNFHSHIFELYPKKEGSSSRHALITGIGQWLSQYTSIDAAIEAAVAVALTEKAAEEPKEGEAAAAAPAVDAPATPVVTPAELTAIFKTSIGTYNLEHLSAQIGSETSLKTHSGAAIPTPLVNAFRSGAVHHDLFEVLSSRKFWCSSYFVEDVAQPSAYLISRELRQLSYGIVLGGEPKSDVPVTEYLRDGLDFITQEVAPVYAVGGDKLPALASVPATELAVRRALFFKALGFTGSVEEFLKLPAETHVPLLALRYWIRHAEPKIKAHEVSAILMSLTLPKDKVKKTAESRPNWLQTPLIQVVAQYQSILLSLQHLNSLLLNVVAPLQHTKVVDGILIHKLFHQLEPKRNMNPLKIIREHNGNTDLFNAMAKFVVDENLAALIDGTVTLEKKTKGEKSGLPTAAPVAVANIFAAVLTDSDAGDEAEEEEEEEPASEAAGEALPGRPTSLEITESPFTVRKKKSSSILKEAVDEDVAALAAEINSIKVEKKLSKNQKQKLKQKAKQQASTPTTE